MFSKNDKYLGIFIFIFGLYCIVSVPELYRGINEIDAIAFKDDLKIRFFRRLKFGDDDCDDPINDDKPNPPSPSAVDDGCDDPINDDKGAPTTPRPTPRPTPAANSNGDDCDDPINDDKGVPTPEPTRDPTPEPTPDPTRAPTEDPTPYPTPRPPPPDPDKNNDDPFRADDIW